MAPSEASRRWTVGLALGVCLYAAALYGLRPASPFEWDEVLFQRALDRFDIARHSPHPPGYPAFVAAARAVRIAVGDPMAALQITSILSAAAAMVLLFALARRLSSPRPAAAMAALLLALTPAFAFHANVGLSDVMATAAGLAAVGALVVALLEPDRLPGAALLAGLSTGVRPHILALVVPIGLWVALRCARTRGASVLAKSLLAATCGVVIVWAPAVAATGTSRFWGAFLAQWNGVLTDEVALRLPGAPLSLVLESWLLDPFGAPWLGVLFWLLVLFGAWSWLRAGHRSLLVVTAGAAASYLLAAMWVLNLTTAARYALPALPFLALLAGGAFAERGSRFRALRYGTFLAWSASAAYWLMPLFMLRSEPAPVWAALGFVRQNFDPARTTVLFDPAFLPHVEYVLKGRGFRAVSMAAGLADMRALARPGDDVLLLTPRTDRGGPGLFARSWRKDRLARMTGGRYEACVVSRIHGDEARPVLAAAAAAVPAPNQGAPAVRPHPAPAVPAAAIRIALEPAHESPAAPAPPTLPTAPGGGDARAVEDDEPALAYRDLYWADETEREPVYWPAPEDQTPTPTTGRDPARAGRAPSPPPARRAFEAAAPPKGPRR